jgi:hypothetical protein
MKLNVVKCSGNSTTHISHSYIIPVSTYVCKHVAGKVALYCSFEVILDKQNFGSMFLVPSWRKIYTLRVISDGSNVFDRLQIHQMQTVGWCAVIKP